MQFIHRKFLMALFTLIALCFYLTGTGISTAMSQPDRFGFEISFRKALSDQPLDGRVLLMLSTDPSNEPRLNRDSRSTTARIPSSSSVSTSMLSNPGKARLSMQPYSDTRLKDSKTFRLATIRCKLY